MYHLPAYLGAATRATCLTYPPTHPPPTQVRFWGKLFTRDGDYLLAETPTPEEASPAASPEERLLLEGLEGPNKYVKSRLTWVGQGRK